MSKSGIPSLVSCHWLREQLISRNGTVTNIVLLETSFEKPDKGYQSYLKSHIATAKYFDLWEGVTPTSMAPRDLPDPAQFEKHAQSHGINKDSHVIIYDDRAVYYAARLWYTFKAFGHPNVSVLDGGKVYWTQLDLPQELGKPGDIKPGNFKIYLDSRPWFKSYKEISSDTKAGVQVVDTRLREDFLGTSEGPSFIAQLGFEAAGVKVPESMHAGHIPGARCIGFPEFVDHNTSCILSNDELIKMFQSNGVDPEKPITGTCYNGVSACLLPLVISKLTDNYLKLFSLYVGSWTEYSQKASIQDVETGENSRKIVQAKI